MTSKTLGKNIKEQNYMCARAQQELNLGAAKCNGAIWRDQF